MKKLGSAIKELRKERNWTQDDLHIRLDVSNSTVTRFEADQTVDMPSAAKMAQWALDCGRKDIALAFRNAIISNLGSDVVELIRKDIKEHGNKQKTASEGTVDQRRLRA